VNAWYNTNLPEAAALEQSFMAEAGWHSGMGRFQTHLCRFCARRRAFLGLPQAEQDYWRALVNA